MEMFFSTEETENLVLNGALGTSRVIRHPQLSHEHKQAKLQTNQKNSDSLKPDGDIYIWIKITF